MNKHMSYYRWLRYLVVLALLCAVAGCTSAPAAPSDLGASSAGQNSAAQGWFALDQLVRSSQLAGVDLHLRAAERTADGIVAHVSFYNNRGEDLQAVRGIDLAQTQLVGSRTYPPSARSASFAQGIAPPGRWISGGGNVGTFTFAGAQGDAWELRVPAFPPVRFTLDLQTTPHTLAALPVGTYEYDAQVLSTQVENIALQVEQVAVENDHVALTVAFTNRNPGDIAFTSTLTGNDAVLLDAQWQQYSPNAVEPTLAQGIAPAGETWLEDAANRGTITFPRPPSGDVLLFAMPGFPPVRLPLDTNADAMVATVADLPPSTEPRPQASPLAAQNDPTSAQTEAAQLLQQINDALRQRNRAAYVAAFAPELQAVQGGVFDRLEALPVENIAWDAAAGPPAALSPDGGVLNNYSVDVQYQVEGTDPSNVFVSTLAAQLAKSNGRWTITTLEGEQPFWLYGPATAQRAGAFWIFSRPNMNIALSIIEQEAQQALDDVNRALPGRSQPTNVMFVTATDDEFEALTGRSGAQFVGVATARFDVRADDIVTTNQAFFLNGAAFGSSTAQDRQRTITHELTHLVLADTTMPFTPAWLSEGAAMFVSSDLPTGTLQRAQQAGGFDTIGIASLSSQTSLGGAAGATVDQTSQEYAYSAFLAMYLIETYGADRFWALYDSFADVPVRDVRAALDAANGDFDAAMQQLAPRVAAEKVQAAYGADLQTLERDYETWLTERLNAER
jgi:hypothetical protein